MICVYIYTIIWCLEHLMRLLTWVKHGLNTGYTIVSSTATFKLSERLGRINSLFDSHEKEKTR